jgi:hypothetical protein
MTPRQRAELARALQAARAEHVERERLERAARNARGQIELELALKLIPALCPDSTIDLVEHVAYIARTILERTGRPQNPQAVIHRNGAARAARNGTRISP